MALDWDKVAWGGWVMKNISIDMFVDELARQDDPNDKFVQKQIARKHNLDLDALLSFEERDIEERVFKKSGIQVNI